MKYVVVVVVFILFYFIYLFIYLLLLFIFFNHTLLFLELYSFPNDMKIILYAGSGPLTKLWAHGCGTHTIVRAHFPNHDILYPA